MELDVDRLHIGDNLDILSRAVPDESIDLVYLDPPFKSNRAYHLIFRDESGRTSDAQQVAFDDSWHWGPTPEAHFRLLAVPSPDAGIPPQLSVLIPALVDALKRNELTAYLVEMAVRLVELHRVLRPTGSIYLHCDPTASHYLKLVMDAIFGPTRFRSEIIWKRSSAHSDTKQGRRQHGRIHDVILFYTKGDQWTWNPVYTAYDEKYVSQFYRYVEPETGRRYRLGDLTGPGGSSERQPALRGAWSHPVLALQPRADASLAERRSRRPDTPWRCPAVQAVSR